MLKNLAILAVLLALPASKLGQEKSNSKATQKESPNTGTPTFSVVTNQTTYPDTKSPKDGPWSPEWGLFWLGIPTLVFVGVQAYLMREHAKHLKELTVSAAENAEASALNAKALIDAERAWISIRTNMEGFDPAENPMVFHWSIRNSGKSVATLIFTNARCLIWNGLDALPQTPQFGSDPIMLNGRILVPKDSYPFHGHIERWQEGKFIRLEQGFRMGEQIGLHILIYGTIKYETLGSAHESNFIEYYESFGRSPEKRDFAVRLNAPATYSKHT
jgi:hypothetical protein